MLSKSKRLPLTLNPELGEIIADIAELRGIKQTRVVTEILEESMPQLAIIREALHALKNNEKPDPQAILNKLLGGSFENLANAFKSLEKND